MYELLNVLIYDNSFKALPENKSEYNGIYFGVAMT